MKPFDVQPVARPGRRFDLVARQPLVEQMSERHPGTDGGVLANLGAEPVAQLIAAVCVAAEPDSITCWPVDRIGPAENPYLVHTAALKKKKGGESFLAAIRSSVACGVGQFVGQ